MNPLRNNSTSSLTNKTRWQRRGVVKMRTRLQSLLRKPKAALVLDLQTFQMAATSEKVCSNNSESVLRSVNSHIAEKIKKGLIEKAKIKAAYSKLKAREQRSQQFSNTSTRYKEQEGGLDHNEASYESNPNEPASLEPHPSRQALINSSGGNRHSVGSTYAQDSGEIERGLEPMQLGRKPPKSAPFSREAKEAELAREEAMKKREAAAAAKVERIQKIAEREEWRRAMEQSRRTGVNGQIKLGRQSKPLLGKIRRMIMEETSHTGH